jgi:chromate transporter
MSEEMFSNILAVAESTPGPIMVNSATYIGSSQAGIFGAMVATLGVVLPSFVIILLIATLFRKRIKQPCVQAVLKGIKPCIIGVILATGLGMLLEILIGIPDRFAIDAPAILLFILLIGITAIYPRICKKALSPIALIVIAAALGILLY